MKKIFLIFLIALSIKSSKEEIKDLSKNLGGYIKCMLSSKKFVDNLSQAVETIFKASSIVEYMGLIGNLEPILKTCFGIKIEEIIKYLMPSSLSLQSSQKKSFVLNQVKDLDAPILLRKYLYDNIAYTDFNTAKKECIEVTSQPPYEKYNYICYFL